MAVEVRRVGGGLLKLAQGGLNLAVTNAVHKFKVCLERVELVGSGLEEELKAAC